MRISLRGWLGSLGSLCSLGLLCCAVPTATFGVSLPRLVEDLGRTVGPNEGSSPHGIAQLGGLVVFAAQPDDYADRLFVTDGSTAGTRELAAPCAPRLAGEIQLLFPGRHRGYYAVTCQDGSAAIWGSDATPEGTSQLIATAAAGSEQEPDLGADLPGLSRWAELGNETYFLLHGQVSPLELWKTNGTEEGTILVRQVDGLSGQVAAGIHATADGHLAFATYSSISWEAGEISFWASDGTTSGTNLGRRMSANTTAFAFPVFGRSESGVFLWVRGANDGVSELWFSDGTEARTEQLAVLHAALSWTDSFGGLKEDDVSVYFIATSDGQRSIWRSDATPESTRPIVDLQGWYPASDLVVLEDRLIVLLCTGLYGEDCELGRTPKSEGFAERFLSECGSGPCDSVDRFGSISRLGERVIFRTATPERVSLWASDGAAPRAMELARLCEGEACWNHCVSRVDSGEDYVFSASRDCEGPFELWASDGTEEMTLRLSPALDELASQLSDAGFARVGETGWVFRASGGGLGLELWRARRQPDSAVVLADLRSDRPGLPDVGVIGEVDGELIFSVPGAQGETSVLRRDFALPGVEELFSLPAFPDDYAEPPRSLQVHATGEDWIFFERSPFSDSPRFDSPGQVYRFRPSSSELTRLFEDPGADGLGALSDEMFSSGERYVFLGSASVDFAPAIYEWRPGSSSVRRVMDLPASSAWSAGANLGKWILVEEERRLVSIDLATLEREVLVETAESSDMNVFSLEHGTIALIQTSPENEGTVLQLWRTDGTTAGTVLLVQIPWTEHFWCSSGFEVSPGAAKGAALLVLDESCGGVQHLWTSDGSLERTRLLVSSDGWNPGVAASAMLGGERYFFALELDPGASFYRYALWKTNGTAAGSQRVAWLPFGSTGYSYFVRELVAGESALYFPWEDAEHGLELWQSDGTEAGTRLVADLEPGEEGSRPSGLVALGDQVLFTATTSAAGAELWQVDGGLDLPVLVEDLYPGPESSSPLLVAATKKEVLFLADDGVVGREVWEVSEPSVAACVASATTLCLANGRFRARAVRRDFAGQIGEAGVVPLTGDSGYFWFFAPGNPEVVLKIVDACGLLGFENFWAFSTGLTNVEVELEIVDTWSGERKTVRTALGEAYGPLFDSGSFRVCASEGVLAPPPTATEPASVPSSSVLPLLEGRFEATATWTTLDGTTGDGQAVPISTDSGYFWFFSPSILEVLVKMTDACGMPGFDNYWVFAGGLTDVEVHLTVRDVLTGELVTHDNAPGHPFTPLLETGGLRVCN